MNRLQDVTEFQEWQAVLTAEWDESRPCLRVCDGTGCRALGSQQVLESLRSEILRAGLDTDLEVVGTGCPGFCECGPLVTIYPERISYQRVKLEDVPEIVEKTLRSGVVLDRLLYTDPATGEHIRLEPDLPFYQKQERRILGLNGRIDPTRLEDYVAQGGYTSLARVLEDYSPDQVIGEVKAAGLRGRGGALNQGTMFFRLCK